MSSRLLLAVVISFAAPAFLAAAPVEILPPEFRGAVQPQVAVAPSGRIHVVFGKNNAILHTTSPDGHTFSAPVKIGELEKLALKMRRGPRVTAADKLVLVTAISHADGNVHAWTSDDTGATWKEAAPLNTVPKSAREGLQALAGDGRGLVAAVWLDLRAKGTEPWIRISRDGGATWGEEACIYQSPDSHICECCVPSVAISPTGEIAAMWRNWLGGSRDMWAAVSTDGGKTFPLPRKLGTESWPLKGCPMDGGSIAFAPAGNWLAVWRRERAILASEASTPEQQLAENAVQPVVAYAGKTPVVLWESRGALMLQRGSEAPALIAENAAAASLVSGPESAVIAWEGTVEGATTILLDRVR